MDLAKLARVVCYLSPHPSLNSSLNNLDQTSLSNLGKTSVIILSFVEKENVLMNMHSSKKIKEANIIDIFPKMNGKGANGLT